MSLPISDKPPAIPDKPTLDGLEEKWIARWEADGTYRFDRSKTRAEIYSIDTPPPTASGVLHVGSAYSYTHTDLIVRYQRMRGKEIFYPMGWDDNGLPTERRVETHFGVRCDPSLPYDPAGERPQGKPNEMVPISRPNFVELCQRLTAEDEQAFEAVWRRIGLSVDWTLLYATINERSTRASQRAFLRNYAAGDAYQAEAPTLWDVDFRTAVAQAELEDREMPGAYHRIRFPRAGAGGDAIEIETTRPELIPACVALVAHPDDPRYQPLFGTEVETPVFGTRVPVMAHGLADPEKGSGIAMICTFGDTTDVTWWRELDLPVRSIVGRDGRIVADAPSGVPDGDAWRSLAGLTVKQAQTKIVELLRTSGDLLGDPRPITHPVKFFERGDRPLEIVTSRQWYVRSGGRDPDVREALIARGKELEWYPDFMRVRYEDWVNGLNGDWLISRQRYFGVPFPVWYRVGEDGEADYSSVLTPEESRLPVDPSTDVPDGFTEAQRGAAGGFVAEPDVMDTWATSSLSPQIASLWEEDDDLFGRVFPMDLRPQAHDIIRTWLFVTTLRSHQLHDSLPWKRAAISGFISDPDRKKMSKSKGNVVTPMALLEEFGSDGFRYWAASGRLGIDTAFDTAQMKVGRRLAVKVLNASKFVLSVAGDGRGDVTEPVDRALLAQLNEVITEATAAFDAYEHTRALERIETFFWMFCDDYLELVKNRAYRDASTDAGAASARGALAEALNTLLRLFAPFLPYVTEDVWSWWQEGSIHRTSWPEPSTVEGDAGILDAAGQVLASVRRAKTEAKLSMRAPVALATVRGPATALAAVRAAEADLREAGNVAQIAYEPGPDDQVMAVAIELATPDDTAAGPP